MSRKFSLALIMTSLHAIIMIKVSILLFNLHWSIGHIKCQNPIIIHTWLYKARIFSRYNNISNHKELINQTRYYQIASNLPLTRRDKRYQEYTRRLHDRPNDCLKCYITYNRHWKCSSNQASVNRAWIYAYLMHIAVTLLGLKLIYCFNIQKYTIRS